MLTAKQENFCQNIIKGMTQADAYRSAYNASRMTDKTIWEKASQLMATEPIKKRVEELRAMLTNKNIMSAQERLEWLTGLIESGDISIGDKLKAADIMNKMTGEYTQKVEASVTNEVNINIELVEDEG